MEVQKVCAYCGKDFIAQRTHTQACSDNCAKRLYKLKKRGEKIEQVKAQTFTIKTQPFEVLKAKEFLTVRETAQLLNCSRPMVYRLIEQGTIQALNVSQRKTIIRRIDIDSLFIN
jgi:excisionase family DNA binding protein